LRDDACQDSSGGRRRTRMSDNDQDSLPGRPKAKALASHHNDRAGRGAVDEGERFMKTMYCLMLTVLLTMASPVLAEDELVSEPDEIFAEFPFVEEWESFSISDEETDDIGGGDEALMIIFETRDESRSSLHPEEMELLRTLAKEPSAQAGASLARLRFGLAVEEVGRWRDQGDAASLESALDLLLSAVELDPTQEVYWSLLGWVHAVGAADPLMDALAERALLTALDIDPKAPRARLTLARLYLGRGEIGRALTHLQKLLPTVPIVFSAEALALTAKAYAESGHAAKGAEYFSSLNSMANLDPVALRLGLGGLRHLSGDKSGREMLQAVRDDAQASPGAREWAGNLLDPAAMRAVLARSAPKDWPLQPGFWAEIGSDASAVFQAARLLDLPVDEELELRCAGLAAEDAQAFAELAPAGRSAKDVARAHALLYSRISVELDRLAPEILNLFPGIVEPMEASILEEDDAEYAVEASETIFEIYASILEGLAAYRGFSPDNRAKLAATVKSAAGGGSDAVLDPIRGRMVDWFDFAMELQARIDQAQAEEAQP
jgi:tetratricopeptide (TPR) repeat protein